jgi:YfiH family protein
MIFNPCLLYWNIIVTNLIANWPAPANIGALTTVSSPGFSLHPYSSNNLAYHVGDREQHVAANRKQLRETLKLQNEPIWLEQTHTNHCIVAETDENRLADAAVTRDQSLPLVIMTADCLPILLCDKQGTEIAAIHAGWRGLVNGIIENTLANMLNASNNLMAWIGPAICQNCYETGAEVRDQFIYNYPCTQNTFLEKNKKIYANLPKMAEQIMNNIGILDVYQSSACTFENDAFYSYRRAAKTGRIATLIWFKQENNNHE